MKDFTKVVRLGTLPVYPGNEQNKKRMSVFAKIKYADGKLSICGVEGPLRNGDALGSCGQIEMHLREPSGLDGYDAAPGWSATMVGIFLSVWDRWHLNDMRAGTREQTAELEKHTFPGYPKSHYEWACEILATAGLHPDANGYKYGSKWLREEVPEDVLAWLAALPETDIKPAWV